MKLIVGLGNPGARYASSRHNVGSRIVERLAERHGIALDRVAYEGRFGRGRVDGVEVALLLPTTFMNRSGRSVAQALESLPVDDPAADLILVFDDVDLPVGRLRIRPGGSGGGQRGVVDVIARLGRDDFPRLRFGIGRPPSGQATAEHVLEPFSPAEEQALGTPLQLAGEALETIVCDGVRSAMDRFNGSSRAGDRQPRRTSGKQVKCGTVEADADSEIPKRHGDLASPQPVAEPPPSHPSGPVEAVSLPQSPRRLAEVLVRPFVRFMELETSSAVLLLAMSVAALVWANSPYGESYEHFWHTPFSISLGGATLSMGLGHWVNDGLMAIFFFLVGMEIKRELVVGELSSRTRAMLPVMGALGGMIVPALIYVSFHAGGPAIQGWGIPMATDIAFAVAAMSVLGKRVPPGLKIFLLALAIADDLGAVLVIAVFYTAHLSMQALGLAALTLGAIYGMNRAGVRSYAAYWVLGAVAWFFTHESGVHATVAGVALGFLTPLAVDQPQQSLLDRGRAALERLAEILHLESPDDHGGHKRHGVYREFREVGRRSMAPLDYLTNQLERFVLFVIMPVFALANAGVVLEAETLSNPVSQKVGLAVALGLLLGKPLGVTLFSYVAVRLGIATLPRGVNWMAVAATGMLAGIGFTVALFISALAFSDPHFTAGSKVGILVGSTVATILGLGMLHGALPKTPFDSKS